MVEAMFSYTCLGATMGDVAFFDRAERISFNALPAAWASPRGGDMWAVSCSACNARMHVIANSARIVSAECRPVVLWLATRITHEVVGVAQHPYLQAVNLVQATKQDPHVWTHGDHYPLPLVLSDGHDN